MRRQVLSTTHLLAAVFRAVRDSIAGRLRSHNVHAEIVVALSPTNAVRASTVLHLHLHGTTIVANGARRWRHHQIADAFRRFGLGDQTRDLLVVKVTSDDDPVVAERLGNICRGQSIPLTDAALATTARLPDIRKAYKLGASSGRSTSTRDTDAAAGIEEERSDMEMTILGAIALRGAT